jgi:hypothetical protein
MKGDKFETTKMFFNLPLERMLQLIDELDALEEHIFMNSPMGSESWFSSLRRREGRNSVLIFRLEFELGAGAPLKDGTTASNVDVAKDLFEREFINRERYEIALRGQRSKDYNLALATKKKLHDELEADLKRHRENGVYIHEDGSLSIAPERSAFH